MVNSIYLNEKEVFVKGFDKTFYLVSCAIMGVITAAALLLTLYLGFSGTVSCRFGLGQSDGADLAYRNGGADGALHLPFCGRRKTSL